MYYIKQILFTGTLLQFITVKFKNTNSKTKIKHLFNKTVNKINKIHRLS